MKLTDRLSALLSEIEGKTCADIGCDHGKLIVSCLLQNKIQKGFAVDISKESLKKAELLAKTHHVSERLTTLWGDGFLPLPCRVDVAIIAGMGAKETVHILSQGDYADTYILSPHQDVHLLRRYLSENKYHVSKDYLLFDKKYYFILVAGKGENNYQKDEMFFGKNNPPSPYFIEYVQKRKMILDDLYQRIGEKLADEAKEERKEIEKCITYKI